MDEVYEQVQMQEQRVASLERQCVQIAGERQVRLNSIS